MLGGRRKSIIRVEDSCGSSNTTEYPTRSMPRWSDRSEPFTGPGRRTPGSNLGDGRNVRAHRAGLVVLGRDHGRVHPAGVGLGDA